MGYIDINPTSSMTFNGVIYQIGDVIEVARPEIYASPIATRPYSTVDHICTEKWVIAQFYGSEGFIPAHPVMITSQLDEKDPKWLPDAYIAFSNIATGGTNVSSYYVVHYVTEGTDVTNMPDDQTKLTLTPLILYSNIPERTGYEFIGWENPDEPINPTTNRVYQPGDMYTIDRNATMLAKWRANTVLIMYNKNSGSDDVDQLPETSSWTYGAEATISQKIPYRSGYVFAGYSTSLYGDIVYTLEQIKAGFQFTITEYMILYCNWNRASYPVIYTNKVNAIAFPENQTKLHGINLVLDDIRPTRVGFNFLKWSGTLLDQTVEYQPGEVYSADSAIELEAVWSTKSFYIFYYYTGGTTGPNTQIKQASEDIRLSDVIPVKEGCKFLGWATKEDGKITYQPGDLYTKNSTINLYAIWEQYSFTITFDGNKPASAKGTVKNIPDNGVKLYWGSFYIPDVVPLLEDYTFTGWSTSPTGKVEYPIGSIMKKERANITLYAVWAAKTYTLSFTAGTNDPVINLPGPIAVRQGGTTVIPNTIPKRTGYQFLYYLANTGSALVQYHIGVEVSNIHNDIVFIAQWKPSYPITYRIDNGTYVEEIIDWKDEDVPYTIMGTIPHKEGYTFIGWALFDNGEVTYTAGDTYTVNEALTLYAVWETEVIYIIYDMDGNYVIGEPLPPYIQRKPYGDTIILYEQPPIDVLGHIFKGWQRVKGSDVIDYPVGTVNQYTSDDVKYVILYPVLQPIAYEIRYHKNTSVGITPGVTYLPDNAVCGYHEEYIIPVTRPVRQGYVFKGYSYTSKFTENSLLPPGSTIIIEQSIDLFAIWEPEQYVYTFQWVDANGLNAVYRESVHYGIEYTFPSTLPTSIPEGMLFNGWTLVAGGAVMYQPGHTILPKYDCTFIADETYMTYVVVYMANGGEYAPMTQQKLFGIELTLTSQYPIKEGYSFEGWSTTPNGPVVYQKGNTYKYSENNSLILYAVWQEKTYTIQYNANGGYAEPSPQIKKDGIPIQITLQKPIRDGYTFKGWATSSDGDIAAYSPGDMYTVESDMTLYAIWAIVTYDIVYDIYGESADVWHDVKTYNIDYVVRETKPTWEGHEFLGWSTTSYQGEIEYHPNDIYTLNKDLTLYSIFESFTFKISYHSAGIVSLPGDQTKVYGNDIILNGMIPYRVGYGFVGYSTEAGSDVATFFPGDTYTKNENLDLYAIWKANEFIVSYNPNGGTDAPAPQRKFYDAKLTLTEDIPYREGYKFIGWGLDREHVSYKPGWTYSMNATVVLYAIWTANYYDVDYLLLGGVLDAPTHQTKKHNENLILYSEKPEKEGYTFIGWGIAPNSTEVVYRPGDLYTKNESIMLYAIYTPKPFTIVYDSYDNILVTKLPNPMTKYFDQDIVLSSMIPERQYYGFLGWSTRCLDTGTESDVDYEIADLYTKNESITLYAVWKRLTYRFTYNANGGTEAPMTQWKTANVPIEITTFIPIRVGYTFKGWSRSPIYTQIAYMPGDICIEDTDLTLYAVWELTTFTIHFDPNGGGGAPSDITKYYGMQVIIPSLIPRREGYLFIGWAVDPKADYALYKAGDIYFIEGSITLYAVWDNIDLWKDDIKVYIMDDDKVWHESTEIMVVEDDMTHIVSSVYTRPK